MEEIIKKLDALDAKVEKGFKEHGETLNEHTNQIDLLARTVADHTERLDRIEHKLEKLDTIEANVEKILTTLDGFVATVKRHDEEIVIMNHNHRRLDRRVEVLEQKV